MVRVLNLGLTVTNAQHPSRGPRGGGGGTGEPGMLGAETTCCHSFTLSCHPASKLEHGTDGLRQEGPSKRTASGELANASPCVKSPYVQIQHRGCINDVTNAIGEAQAVVSFSIPSAITMDAWSRTYLPMRSTLRRLGGTVSPFF